MPALAEDRVFEDMSDDAHTAAGQEKKRDFLIVPIPQSNPALDSGLVLAAMLIQTPENSVQPWITGAGAMYTTNDSWGIGGFQSMSFARDKFRVRAFGGYANLNLNFYGIGGGSGDSGISAGLDQRGYIVSLLAQMRIAPRFYVGPSYEFQRTNSRLRGIDIPLGISLPEPQLRSQTSSLGPVFTYDSRDNTLNPRSGVFVNTSLNFNDDFLGSDFTYRKLKIAANLYIPLNEDTGLAFRNALCAASSGAPFYDLCLYGESSDLRGYEMGRYRDGAYWALQGELRQNIGSGFGAVVFAGIGGIAPKLSQLDHLKVLPSAGAGLRYVAAKANNVNVRLDVAFGKDSHGIYVGIGEAF